MVRWVPLFLLFAFYLTVVTPVSIYVARRGRSLNNSNPFITRAVVQERTSKDSVRSPKSFSGYQFVIRPAQYVTHRFTRPLPSRRGRNLNFSKESDYPNSISNFDPYKYKIKTYTKGKEKKPGLIISSPSSFYKFKKSPSEIQQVKPSQEQQYFHFKRNGVLAKKYISTPKYSKQKKLENQKTKLFPKRTYVNQEKKRQHQKRSHKFEEWMSDRFKALRRHIFERMETGRNQTKSTVVTNANQILQKNQLSKLKPRGKESKEQHHGKRHQEEQDQKEVDKEEQIQRRRDQGKLNEGEQNDDEKKRDQDEVNQKEQNHEGNNQVRQNQEEENSNGKNQEYEEEEAEETNNFRINVFAPPRPEARSLDFDGKGGTVIRPASMVYRRKGKIVQSRKAKILKILFDQPLNSESKASKQISKRKLLLPLL